MTKIRVKDEKKVLEHIHWLIEHDIASVRPILLGEAVGFDERLEVLTSKIEIRHETVRDNKRLTLQFIRQATVNLKIRGLKEPSWGDFERELDDAIRDYLNRAMVDYRVLVPFHISGSWVTRKRWFNVLGMKFKKTKWSTVRRLPGWDQFLAQTHSDLRSLGYKGELSWIYNLIPLVVDVRARTYQEAFHQVSHSFELLRALFNLVKDYGMVHWQATPRPLGVSLPSPVFGLFRDDGEFEKLYFEVKRYQYPTKSYMRKNLVVVERSLKRIATVSDPMQRLLIDVLLKYGQAMDTADWRDAFLSLWQVLEGLSLRNVFSVRMKKVPSRIVNLMGVRPPLRSLKKDLIDSLAKSRHLLVHQGRFSEEGLIEVNLLKGIIEEAINALFALAKRFPTLQSLQDFYTNVK